MWTSTDSATIVFSSREFCFTLLFNFQGINPKKISRGQLDEGKMGVILPTMDRMSNKDNLYFDCRAGLTLGEVKAKAKKIKIKYGLDVIFIDHIGKIKPDNPRSSRNDQIGQISNDLKNMAKDQIGRASCRERV